MKTTKFKLKKLNVNSFITALDEDKQKTILGEANAIDTSKINQCTPHGSVVTCPPSAFPCDIFDRLTRRTVNNTIWSFCRCGET